MSVTAFAQIAQASQLLLERGFTQASVTRALEMVGHALDVDRVYVFENREHGPGEPLLTDQRYEWSAASATPQLDNPEMQGVPFREYAPAWVKALEVGDVVCELVRNTPSPMRELLEQQDIRSVLVCPITVSGRFWGFVGFDDCRQERSWPDREVALLKNLARALAGTLRHEKLRTQLDQARLQLQEVMRGCNVPRD